MSSIFDRKNIVGTYDLNTEEAVSETETDNSVFRLRFAKKANSTNSFVYAKFCVLTAEDTKIFAGVFVDNNNFETTVIQIPLVGQTIADLVDAINQYPDVVAEVLSQSAYISSANLKNTALTTSSSIFLYFEVESKVTNSTYLNLQKDLKFFLTSAEPNAFQNNMVQSLGGFVSNTEVYKVFEISAPVSIYDKIISVNENSLSENYTLLDLQKLEYLQINDEIVRIAKWSGLNAYVSERNVFNTGLRMHSIGDLLREIKNSDFFDRNLSADFAQYRCIALKNTSETETYKNVRIFFNTPSRNSLSKISIALEEPSSNYYSGQATTGGVTAFSDSNLVNAYQSDYFVGSAIVFKSNSNLNQIRYVTSYVPSSGTIVFDQRLIANVAIGDKYYIDTRASYRNKTALKTPTGSRISEFYNPQDFTDGIPINIKSNRADGNDLLPNQVIYIWLERSILEINDEYYGNRFSLSVKYSRV